MHGKELEEHHPLPQQTIQILICFLVLLQKPFHYGPQVDHLGVKLARFLLLHVEAPLQPVHIGLVLGHEISVAFLAVCQLFLEIEILGFNLVLVANLLLEVANGPLEPRNFSNLERVVHRVVEVEASSPLL